MDKVTQAELARLLGVSRPYVNKLVTAGTLVLDEDGKIDQKAAAIAIAAHADPVRQLQAASDDDTPLMQQIRASASGQAPIDLEAGSTNDGDMGPSYQEARTRRERAAAAVAELALAERMQLLVSVESVRRAAYESARDVHNKLIRMPDSLAPLLAAETDAVKIHALMSHAIREALNGLAERSGHVASA